MTKFKYFQLALILFLSSTNIFSQVGKNYYHPLSNSVVLSVEGGSNYPLTDYENPGLGWLFSGGLEYYLPTSSQHIFAIGINGGMQNIKGDLNYLGLPETFNTEILKGGIEATYSYATTKSFFPFITVGGSYSLYNFSTENVKSRFYDFSNGGETNSILIDAAGGFKYKIAENVSLDFSLGYHYTLGDNVDAISVGKYNDFYLSGNFGISFTLWNRVDSDEDGILDDVDQCPNEAEDIDGYQDDDGCPDIDNDGDGIPDTIDGCQNIKEDIDGYQDDDGCPDLDNDGDGIEDINDNCPDIKEDSDGFEDNDGCPDVDNDSDGILDINDTCPDKAEVFNGYKDNDGCPDEAPKPKYYEPEPKPKKIIKQPSKKPKKTPTSSTNAPSMFSLHGETIFVTNTANLKSTAYSELNRIIGELKKYPNTSWRIEAHVDRHESKTEASRISKNQALAILNYFVSMGLSPSKFEAIGFGDSSPIASNNTVYGKMKNRRIVIKRIN